MRDEFRSPARAQHASARRQDRGCPATVSVALIDEDPANPRAEFPEPELEELAADLRLRGILMPLVVHPANRDGRYLLHFGARRLRAAIRAGLQDVPVVVRDAPGDHYAQVAENLKRSNLSPLDLARFIRQQIDAGDTQAEVSRRLGMNLTTVAHHLSLLDLPPVLGEALKTGRCTSPRTLHELSKLHEQQPERVTALIDSPGGITRQAVAALRVEAGVGRPTSSDLFISRADAACDRLNQLLDRIVVPASETGRTQLASLRVKLQALSHWPPPGSDGQTPSQAKR